MKMKTIASGSKGNCSYLFLEEDKLVFFDLGLTFKKIQTHLLEEESVDLTKDKLDVLILVTHEHTDHWKTQTYNQFEKQESLNLTLMFPQKEDVSEMWEGYSIDSQRFKHGATYTNFFVVDRSFGYLTDCDGDEVIKVLLYELAYGLDELLIEANYDDYYLDYSKQASIANGYDVSNGFGRHLSKQQSAYLVSVLEPKDYRTIHHSNRFYEVK